MGLIAAALLAVTTVVAPTPASAATKISVTAFTASSVATPLQITTGPDGNLWFVNVANEKPSIGRITPSGTISAFTHPSISSPRGIVAGPDGALWFGNAGDKSIGRVSTSGAFTFYEDPELEQVWDLTVGSDGNIWFTDGWNLRVGRITTGGEFAFFDPPEEISLIRQIVAGPDGNLWYGAGDRIGRISPDGSSHVFFQAAGMTLTYSLAFGPDGNLWMGLTNPPTGIGRLTPGGVFTKFTNPELTTPWGITAGPDGAMWFTSGGGGGIDVGRITTAGAITMYETGRSGAFGITTGPDDNVWFTDGSGIVRVNLSDPPVEDTTPPSTSMKRPSTRWNLSRTVPVSWTATDVGGSGVATHDVNRRLAGYAAPLPASSTSWVTDRPTSSISFIGSKGATYCMRARSTDGAGNVGAFSSERCTAIPFTADQLQYFSITTPWTGSRNEVFYGGMAMSTGATGSKVSLSNIVGARRIAVVATTCPTCGFLAVHWNGVRIGTVSLRSTTTRHRVPIDVATFTAPASGRISLVSLSAAPVSIEGLGISKVPS